MAKEILARIEKGRKIRSFLFITASNDLGEINNDDLMDVCLSIEMSHAASVLVDDILDGDDVRHGALSSQASLGTPFSTLLSHVLCAEAIQLVSRRPRILNHLLDTYKRLSWGEMFDVLLPEPQDWMYQGYGEFIYQKTSAVFEYSLLSAALAAGREDAVGPLKALGHAIGKFYQHSNDFYDLQPHNLRKRHSSNEAWRVTFSLPLALYLQRFGSGNILSLLNKRILAFDEWIVFLEEIWRTEIRTAGEEALKHCETQVLELIAKSPLSEKSKIVLRDLALLIGKEDFWYHSYDAS